MDWIILIYAVIYSMIGWFFADQCEDNDELTKILVFITWPLIVGLFILCVSVMLIIGLVYVALSFIQWITQKVTGGSADGVV